MQGENPVLLRKRARLLGRRSDFLTGGLLGKIWLDLLLVVMLFLVVDALWRDANIHPLQPALVAKPGGILPFHVIQPGDLRLDGQDDTSPPPDRAAALAGRYAFTFVRAGAVVDPKQLSSGERLTDELNARALMQLRVRQTSLFTGMNPPFAASLAGSPTERGTTVLLEKDLLVLDLQKDSDSMAAIVAVPSADEATLAGLLARNDLLLVAGPR
jgi:hypothetical protein